MRPGFYPTGAAPSGAVAFADGGAIRVFEPSKLENDITLPDAQLVAYDGAGNLVAATAHGLYQVSGSSTKQIFDAGTRTIHALAGAGAGVLTQVLTKGRAIRVPAETVLTFKLESPLRVVAAR